MKNETQLPSTLDLASLEEAAFSAAPADLGPAIENYLKVVLGTVWTGSEITKVVAWTGDSPAADNDFCLTEDGAFHGFFFDDSNDRFGFHMSETAGTWSVQFTAG